MDNNGLSKIVADGAKKIVAKCLPSKCSDVSPPPVAILLLLGLVEMVFAQPPMEDAHEQNIFNLTGTQWGVISGGSVFFVVLVAILTYLAKKCSYESNVEDNLTSGVSDILLKMEAVAELFSKWPRQNENNIPFGSVVRPAFITSTPICGSILFFTSSNSRFPCRLATVLSRGMNKRMSASSNAKSLELGSLRLRQTSSRTSCMYIPEELYQTQPCLVDIRIE